MCVLNCIQRLSVTGNEPAKEKEQQKFILQWKCWHVYIEHKKKTPNKLKCIYIKKKCAGINRGEREYEKKKTHTHSDCHKNLNGIKYVIYWPI